MRKLLVVLAVLVVIGFPITAKAENLGFDIGILNFNPKETTAKNGNGSFVAITFPVDNLMEVGFYNEGLGVSLKNDAGGNGISTIVNTDVSITGIQMVRTVSEKAGVGVGLRLGMADISGSVIGAATFADTVPMADILVKWSVLSGGDKAVKTELAANFGYRIMQITPIDPDTAAGGDFVNLMDDLGGFWLSISLGLSF